MDWMKRWKLQKKMGKTEEGEVVAKYCRAGGEKKYEKKRG